MYNHFTYKKQTFLAPLFMYKIYKSGRKSEYLPDDLLGNKLSSEPLKKTAKEKINEMMSCMELAI